METTPTPEATALDAALYPFIGGANRPMVETPILPDQEIVTKNRTLITEAGKSGDTEKIKAACIDACYEIGIASLITASSSTAAERGPKEHQLVDQGVYLISAADAMLKPNPSQYEQIATFWGPEMLTNMLSQNSPDRGHVAPLKGIADRNLSTYADSQKARIASRKQQ